MDNMKYNGWSSRETWLVNLHFGEHFQDLKDEGIIYDRDDIETFLHDVFDANIADRKGNLFMEDIISRFIGQVDLDELVDHIWSE